MDKWLVNMIAGGVLSALLVVFGTSTFVDILYPKGGAPEGGAGHDASASADHGTAPAATEPKLSLAALLGKADVAAGEKAAKKCAACHSFDQGGANKIGPNLHGVVGQQVAAHQGFAYSEALKSFGGAWDYEKLDCFIKDPKGCVAGTKMAFAGVKKDSERADIIAYLRSISPSAPPLPEDKAAEAPAPVAPAGQAASAGAAPKAH
jgi:cytochrome c